MHKNITEAVPENSFPAFIVEIVACVFSVKIRFGQKSARFAETFLQERHLFLETPTFERTKAILWTFVWNGT